MTQLRRACGRVRQSSERRDHGGAIMRVAAASVTGRKQHVLGGACGQEPRGEGGLRERDAPMPSDVASGSLVVAAGISLPLARSASPPRACFPWSPATSASCPGCRGPTPARGAVLAFAYAVGLGVPFVLVAVGCAAAPARCGSSAGAASWSSGSAGPCSWQSASCWRPGCGTASSSGCSHGRRVPDATVTASGRGARRRGEDTG